ncbi:hypothetical protein I656_03447 [Geobacillus sp. WSUCF1]|nr:hypothetical protein I656_03447 [Geobacillus sp. WSUCF1]
MKNEKKRLNRKFARALFSLVGQKMQEYERTFYLRKNNLLGQSLFLPTGAEICHRVCPLLNGAKQFIIL